MDQEIALQVKTPPLSPPFDPASPLSNAQTILGNQTALEAGKTRLQMLNRENTGQDIQFRGQLIRDAAAHALDADSWDAAMRAAAEKGAPEASQYVGRYTPLLQQRLFDAYAGGQGAGANGAGAGATPTSALASSPATGPDLLDRMYQNATPQQMAMVLKRSDTMLAALSTVKDQASYDRAVNSMVAAGMPEAAALRGPYNPLAVVNLYNKTLQHANYLQDRMAGVATGAPSPLVKNDVQNVGNVAYSVDPYAGTAKALTPAEPKQGGVDEYGNPVYVVPDQNVPGGLRRVDAASLPATGNATIADAARLIQGAENATGNPAAKNPRSTATGNGQFIEKTWLETVKEARPDLAKQLSDKQLLALRNDPEFSDTMTQALATKNADALKTAGLPVTTASLALAHRFGADGATKILNAAPNTPMDNLVSTDVLKANPELRAQTAGAVAQGLARQVGNQPVDVKGQESSGKAPADAMNLHGDDYLKTLPADKANVVRMIAEGRAPYPSGYVMKTPYGRWLQTAIGQFEPGFTAQTYQQRQKAFNNWYGGGEADKAVKSLDQALGHGGVAHGLANEVDKQGNYQYPALNKLANVFNEETGRPTNAPLKINAHALADELGKIWKGGNLSDTEIKAWAEGFPVTGSITQQKQSIAKLMDLVQGGVDALENQRQRDLGPMAAHMQPVMTPELQQRFDAIKSWAGGKRSLSLPSGGADIDPRDAAALKANSHNPAAAAAIDKKYGSGTAARLLGQ